MFSKKNFPRIPFVLVVLLLFMTGCSSTVPSESQSIEDVAAYGTDASSEPSTIPADDQSHTDQTVESSSEPSSAEPAPTPESTPAPVPDPAPNVEPAAEVHDYVLNTNNKKFHKPDCSSVKAIKDKNRKDVTDTRENIISSGYDPCKNCNP